MYVNALRPAWRRRQSEAVALAAPQREELRRRRQERKRNAGLAKTAPRPDDRQLATPKGAPKASLTAGKYDRPNGAPETVPSIDTVSGVPASERSGHR